MCVVGRLEREGGERSEKVSGEGFGKFVGGKKYRDRFLSIFNFQFRSGPGPLRFCCTPGPSPSNREFPDSVSGISLFDFGIFPI